MMKYRDYAIQTKRGDLFIVDFQGLRVYYRDTTPVAYEIAGKITGSKGYTQEILENEGIECDALLHYKAFRGSLGKLLERYYI